MERGKFKIVLYNPEIPGNTGSIGRTSVALNTELILIKPYGFSLDEKEVRRAGLDYWKYVNLTEYNSWEDFINKELPQKDLMFFFSRFANKTIYEAKFIENSYLIFGAETKGLPKKLKEEYPNNFYSIPQFSDKIRSLNLANAATTIAYEAIRQQFFSKL